MGVKERREREKQALKESILAAAREVAAEEGWNAVTIRKVAELIEYSPPTIYEYFESKEAILQELALEGFRTMYAMMREGYDGAQPEDKLLAVSLAHWDFAWEHPELYQVMHGLGVAQCTPTHAPPEIERVFRLVKSAVTNATGLVDDDPRDLHGAIDLLRGAIHGLVSYSMQGQLMGGRERGRKLVERAVGDLVLAWRVRR